jgi:23S rRNA (cytosine1962-C5)-methyltransferase
MNIMAKVILKPGREKSVLKRHPWVFSGAIASLEGEVTNGVVAEVVSSNGIWLARGSINRRSQIVVRILTWNEDESIDGNFWHSRLERAWSARSALASDPKTNAYRLVNAEGDGLPGLIVDRYGDWLVVQFHTRGMECVKNQIVKEIECLSSAKGIYERSEGEGREKEGLPQSTGVLSGDDPPDMIEILENGLRFLVDVKRGHKTGFYLDQRDNHRRSSAYLKSCDVLNCFSYTGAFAVYAASAGAKNIINIDSSQDVLELAKRNYELNKHDFSTSSKSSVSKVEYLTGDVFTELRRYRAENRKFDAVILDPPKFAQRNSQIKSAARGYQDINRLSMSILRPGGILVTFSCSGLISPDLFQKIIFSASLEAVREVQILEKLGHSPDHPILITVPETEYLKGFICRVR